MKISLNRSDFMGKSWRHLVKTISLTLTASLLSSGLSIIAIPSANAADPSVALPASVNATTSFATVSGVSVSNYTTVQATISVTAGNIKISTTSGLTAPTGYSSADWTSNSSTVISFSGTQANVNSALATLQYKATAIGTADTITVATFASGAAFDASSGRIYEVVNNGTNINWELARCKAKYSNSDVTYSGTSTLNNDRCTSSTTLTRRTSSGLKGYLATITSLAEHQFLMSKLNDVGWIGGADTDSEGTFIWMDGPEAGQVFFTPGQSSRRDSFTVSGSVPGFSYGANRFNYFSDGEPNDSSGEDFAEFGFGNAGVGRSWNDCRNACGRSKYVIEYGGEGGETLQGASGTIAVRTAPTAPTSVSPTAGALQASLTWAAPSSAGGTPVTGYLVEYKASGGSWVTATSNTGSATTSYTVTGLTAGTTYTFRVSAINNAGTSTASTESSGVSINKANQTITFSSIGTSSKSYPYSQALSMSTSGSSGTGAITYAIAAGGSATSCALSNSSASATISATTSGTCLVAASIAADVNYNSAISSTLTFTFSKATQSALTISSTSGSFGTPLTLATNGGSGGGSVTYSYAAGTTNCTLSGSTLTADASGTCLITATKAADSDYSAISSTQTTITFAIGSTTATVSIAAGELIFRQSKAITAVASVAGKLTFRANRVIIPGCKNLTATVANSFTRACSYRPSTRGYVTVTVTFTPTNNSFGSAVVDTERFFVKQRSGAR